jgi:hypothetical protein
MMRTIRVELASIVGDTISMVQFQSVMRKVSEALQKSPGEGSPLRLLIHYAKAKLKLA